MHRTMRSFVIVALGLVPSTLACQRKVAEPPPPAADRQAVAQAASDARTAAASASPPSVPSAADPNRLRFAVIGDYGAAGPAERKVADIVKAYKPELVITTGDNNYPRGAAATIDRNIGQYYAELIAPYRGKYGTGAAQNRFFPSLGNHDWYTDGAAPYLEYFTLPGNERYYSVSVGPVDFYALDSDPREPDGITKDGKQAAWLKAELKQSKGRWRIAYMHHPPYSSGPHGSEGEMQWPFREWGVDLVLAGHDHTYERVVIDGLTYLVNGLGGNDEYEFNHPIENSIFRYNAKHGAQLAEATPDELRLAFVNVDGTRIDEVVLKHER